MGRFRDALGILLSLMLGLCAFGWTSEGWPPPPVIAQAAKAGWVFPDLEGWQRSVEVQFFSPETLFDYIDGAAELYLSYEFRELQVAEYKNKEGATLLVELYRFRTPLHAFGIYSQERPPEGNDLKIGVQAHREGNSLNLIAGECYAKVSGYNMGPSGQEVLETLAKRVVEKLGTKGSLPEILKCFSEKGKKPDSEEFIAKDFLGYSFFHSAFRVRYSHADRTFSLFIMEARDSKDCREMVSQYARLTNLPERELKEAGSLVVRDPHHGEVAFAWRGRYLWGVLDLPEGGLRAEVLALLEEGLKKFETTRGEP